MGFDTYGSTQKTLSQVIEETKDEPSGGPDNMSSTNCGCPNTSYPEPVSTVNITQTILQFGETFGVWQQEVLTVSRAAETGSAPLSATAITAEAINFYINGVLQQQGEDYLPTPTSITVLNIGDIPLDAVFTASYLSVSQGGVGDVPVGTIVSFAANVLPANSSFLACDGAAYNASANAEYVALYAVIGNTYGGTGAADFQVPDLQLPFYDGTQLIYGPAYIKF